MKNKKGVQMSQMKRDLAQLLESGQDRTARIRVEHLIREEKMVAAYDLIEIYCELIAARLPIIESQNNCPIDLKEAITSVVFASPRCADIPELLDVKKHFTAKYGKEFVTAALELHPGCGIGRLLVEKLSAIAPDVQTKVKVLTAIAEEHNIEWDSKSFEEKESKRAEELLNGPSTSKKASGMQADIHKIQAPSSHTHNVSSTDPGVIETTATTHPDSGSSVNNSELQNEQLGGDEHHNLAMKNHFTESKEEKMGSYDDYSAAFDEYESKNESYVGPRYDDEGESTYIPSPGRNSPTFASTSTDTWNFTRNTIKSPEKSPLQTHFSLEHNNSSLFSQSLRKSVEPSESDNVHRTTYDSGPKFDSEDESEIGSNPDTDDSREEDPQKTTIVRTSTEEQPSSGKQAGSEGSFVNPRTSTLISEPPTWEDSGKRASHVHPKLPDYDSIAAHLQSLRMDRR